jgi:hypothetical protein
MSAEFVAGESTILPDSKLQWGRVQMNAELLFETAAASEYNPCLYEIKFFESGRMSERNWASLTP